jgi:hypothetical protein
MLKQVDLAFINAMFNELSAVFLQELRKLMLAKMKTLAVSKTGATSASALKHNTGVRIKTPTNSRNPREKLKISPTRTACLRQPATALRPGIGSMTDSRPMAPRANRLPSAAGN